MMLAFFIVATIVEILALIGLVVLYLRLREWHELVRQGREAIPVLRDTLSGKLRVGRLSSAQILQGLKFIEKRMPWWLKGILQALQWIGKFRLQTS